MITQLAGNGRILLTVNGDGEWNQLFYPYPGQFQHLREMRLGIYEVPDRRFSWLRAGNGFSVRQEPSGPANFPESRWNGHGLSVRVEDLAHPNHDLVLRVIRVRADPARSVRLFSYQSLQIAESLYQETAYVDAAARSVVHYKRRYYFEFFSDPTFTRAVCGEHTLKGLRGTYVDAEDGLLEGRTIAHGAADSAIQWDVEAVPDRDQVVALFLAIGSNIGETRQIREYVRGGEPGRFEEEARAFWKAWVRRRMPRFPADLSADAASVYQTSVVMMRHAAGPNGSIIASPDSAALAVGGDTYNYCWWRDGGYVSKAMDEAGLYEYAQRFLEFAGTCQSPDGSFLHRHFPDGAVGSTWHPPPFLQVDQTATVVAAVWHHFKRGGDSDALLGLWPLVKGAATFLTAFRDPETGLPAASFDLWEERKGIHTYSTATVIHALERAARIARELGKDATNWHSAADEMRVAARRHLWDAKEGRFLRSLDPRDAVIDSSVLLALKLGLVAWDDPLARQTVDTVEGRLWNKTVGGLARFEGDEYCGHENPWVICTLWLAEAKLRLGDRERGRELIEWVATHATPTRLLSEQLDGATGEPKSATPLTWSHSTFVDVVHKYRLSMEQVDPTEE
ncbi:MAG: glycoside hydrolase family 15 protein [Thermoplasmata archaeon]|nr:glycoside hydrolase family 15 protein [Thermoplasmata archaeon]